MKALADDDAAAAKAMEAMAAESIFIWCCVGKKMSERERQSKKEQRRVAIR